jgi:hypothetical protein
MVLFLILEPSGMPVVRLLRLTSTAACCSSSCATSSKMSSAGLKAGLCMARIGRRGFAWRGFALAFISVVYSMFAVVSSAA